MTNRLELNWKVDGFVDEQRYYCSETAIDPLNLPLPKAVLAGDVRTYVDTDVEFGKTYFVRVGSVKNGVEKISDEKLILVGAEWTPLNLSPSLYFDASNVLQTSNVVSQMTDLSANAFHATQSSNSNRPILNNGSLLFNGSNSYMSLSDGALNTLKSVDSAFIFAVFSKNTLDQSSNERPVFTFSTANYSTRCGIFSGLSGANTYNKINFLVRRLDSDSSVIINSPFDCIAGRKYIVFGEVDYINRRSSLFIDGVLIETKTGIFTAGGTTSNTTSPNARVCANSAQLANTFGAVNLDGLVIKNHSISNFDRQKLEGWAAHKYGLTDNLPIDHPYKTLVPTV